MRNYNYKKLAKIYDLIELEEYPPDYQNKVIKNFFTENEVKKVLDFTCGTGAQTLYLKQHGFQVTANDICKEMLEVAKEKANGLGIPFHNKDIRYDIIGEFDAVISQNNAIGHLTKKEFNIALQNINNNLKQGGYFIFDIHNLTRFRNGGFTPHKFIDSCVKKDNKKLVRICKNKFNAKKGIIKLRQKIYYQEPDKKLETYRNNWDMQIYTSKGLRTILSNCGFEVIKLYNRNGGKFEEHKTWNILTICKKTLI